MILRMGICLFLLSALGWPDPVAAFHPIDISRVPITIRQIPNETELVRSSDLIVEVELVADPSSRPTGRTVGGRAILHYAQAARVRNVLKGPQGQSDVQLVTSGLDPVPEAQDPLNRQYTGPLAEGSYILFLKKVHGTDHYYTLNGGWQGVYPLHNGVSIALEEGGFPFLNGLTVPQMGERIRQLLASRRFF